MITTNPFTELDYSGWLLDPESLIIIEEIKEIDKRIEFLDNIKIGNYETAI